MPRCGYPFISFDMGNNVGIGEEASPFDCLYPSYFKLHVRWLRSLTRITYLSKFIGTPSLAAFLKLELFRGYTLLLAQRMVSATEFY